MRRTVTARHKGCLYGGTSYVQLDLSCGHHVMKSGCHLWDKWAKSKTKECPKCATEKMIKQTQP